MLELGVGDFRIQNIYVLFPSHKAREVREKESNGLKQQNWKCIAECSDLDGIIFILGYQALS